MSDEQKALAIGLDREAILLNALTEARKIADNATALSEQGYKTGGMTAGLSSGIDRALALLALAAPAEGYVLVPVERLESILLDITQGAPLYARRKLEKLIPAAPTGKTAS